MKIKITKEFEVDPKIAHAIILLNDKGYKQTIAVVDILKNCLNSEYIMV